MRSCLLALATLVFACGNIPAANAQGNEQCNCPKCQAARAAQQQPAAQAGYQHAMAADSGPGSAAFPANGHPYGPPRHSYSPHAKHPGRPLDGGWYGFFGGAHGTPGYPHFSHHKKSREYVGPQGPPTAGVAYPYYTTRGPRDFLIDNPPSIGR